MVQIPFIAVFAICSSKSSVQSVEPLRDGINVVGAKAVSKLDKSLITDYIISQGNPDSIYTNKELNLMLEECF